jgi:DNA adenine methylase
MTTAAVQNPTTPRPATEALASPMRPPLKWAGGKRWQLPHLRTLWASHAARRLVEPFCGGLAVAFGLQPQQALLNDANPHLIHFYRWLKRGFQIELPLENDEQLFYAHRARFNALLDEGREETAEASALFYFLNRTGYNGLCRFNQRGRFNVPFGRHATIRYRRDFSPYAEAVSRWTFTSTDFEKVPLQPNDFVYADPPYDVPFTQYSKDGFDWEAQERTAAWLARHPGPVVLANQATDRITALYRGLGFDLVFLKGPRMISCTGERRPAREVLATRHL